MNEYGKESPCKNLVDSMVKISKNEANIKNNFNYIEDVDKRLRELDKDVGEVKRREVVLVGFATIGANLLFKGIELLIQFINGGLNVN